MGSRRRLTSVADGLARAFVGRNNDVDGWWALGVLLPGALAAEDPVVDIDLLTGQTSPDFADRSSGLRLLAATWTGYLRWSVERHGLAFGVVRDARLKVRFDTDHPSPSGWARGMYPFTCTVTIDDDRGHRRERFAAGHCFPHDPGVARCAPAGYNRLYSIYGGKAGEDPTGISPRDESD